VVQKLFGTPISLRRKIFRNIRHLAFSALQNNDKVGLLFIYNEVELVIPQKKEKKSRPLELYGELLEFSPKSLPRPM